MVDDVSRSVTSGTKRAYPPLACHGFAIAYRGGLREKSVK
jgi:hypothetical protein